MKKRVILAALILCLVLAGGLAYCYFRPVDCRSAGNTDAVLYNGVRYVRVFEGPSGSIRHGFVRGRTEEGAFLYEVKDAEDCICLTASGRSIIYQRESQ